MTVSELDLAIHMAGRQLGRQLQVAGIDGKVRNPRTMENGAIRYVQPEDWTSGFFPGSLWLMYELTRDAGWRTAARIHTAAILASALYELSEECGECCLAWGDRIMASLSSTAYNAASSDAGRDANPSRPVMNGGFLLMHSTGALPMGREIDVPLNYADYYYLEALLRRKRIFDGRFPLEDLA
jgi:hypothetical protein